MIIGIDIRMLARGTRTGIEAYTEKLLSNMLGLDTGIEFRLFYNGYKKVRLSYGFLDLPNVKLIESSIPNRILDISSKLSGIPEIDRLLGGIDIMFSPHIFLSSLSRKCKSVVTFHDLSFEKYPEFYSKSKSYWHFSMDPKNQAKRASRIITASQSTKNDLISLYGTDPKKIRVIYSGIEQEMKNGKIKMENVGAIRKKYRLPEKYILYLGTLEPRKNIVGLIKAYELFRTKNDIRHSTFDIPKLVIAGSKGWLYKEIFDKIDRSPVKNDIILTGFVEEKDKEYIYRLADLFVYPSFYEGFGFPPLEAMSHGVPAITSNVSSLPEAVGDSAIMVDPYDLDELANAIENVLTDDKLRDILIKKGFERIKKFSWQRCARETLETLIAA
ncbi:MAG: glycosyltransferase family 1 protein [Candidatus Paceibacterota bacterium]|jgi:glycosyltransferase involved in cell wall biosynthesis